MCGLKAPWANGTGGTPRMWQALQGAASAGVHGSAGHHRLQRKWRLGEAGRGTRAVCVAA